MEFLAKTWYPVDRLSRRVNRSCSEVQKLSGGSAEIDEDLPKSSR